MPVYSYACLREAGGCGQEFKDFKAMHDRQNVQCPNCSMYGSEQYNREDGTRGYRIVIQMPLVNHIKDIDHQDGRTGDRIPMPALGPNVSVGSRRELKQALQVAREQYFQATNGPHSTLRPFKDPGTGEVVYEKITTERIGVDLGELRPVEVQEQLQPQRSPFDPNLSADQHIAKLSESVGPVEHPVGNGKRRKK